MQIKSLTDFGNNGANFCQNFTKIFSETIMWDDYYLFTSNR